MSKYWKDHYNSNVEMFPDSPLKQVDWTLNDREVNQLQINLCIEAIIKNLSVVKSDLIADICCGNGFVTKRIAELSRGVLAVDFSEKLIEQARRLNARPNIEYVVSDVAALNDEFFNRFSKLYMSGAIQHLDSTDFRKLLKPISRTPQFSMLYVIGVPDLEKLRTYYDTDEKMTFYRQREAAGRPHMGKWWSKDEISSIVESTGLKVSYVPQNSALCTAYYRYDCLIEKG